MVAQIAEASTYALGHDEAEQRRLDLQGAFLRPHTERLFRDAGLAPGLRVLDVGCGTGDVSVLLADLVGPAGEVVGVDRSALVLATARRRVAERGLRHVRFVEGDLAAIAFRERFDAIVGRFVLMHLPDPAGTLRNLTGALRPGGIVAFQCAVHPTAPLSTPAHPLFDRTVGWIREGLAKGGAKPDMGLRLPAVFRDAGLPAPELRLDGVLCQSADPAFMAWRVGTIRSLLPTIERFGIATPGEIGIATLAERLVAEQAEIGGVLCPILLGGAFARTPLG